ncbi:MAG TPA: hypothetical protein VGR16_04740 [Thermomicrobiales bacterium]|nr:hypothetical protein [Thermomicrobiales bacterium]
MYPGYPSVQPMLVGKHEDYLEEARRQRLSAQARVGEPPHPRLAAMRRVVGTAMVALGQRVAGPAAESPVSLPAYPTIRGAR